jgi:hypothetical protein
MDELEGWDDGMMEGWMIFNTAYLVFYGISWLKVARGHMDVIICRDVACNVPTYDNIHGYGTSNIRSLIIKLSFAG